MMKTTPAHLLLPALLLPAGLSWGLAQPAAEMAALRGADELDDLVAERMRAAESMDLEALWKEAHELAILVGDEEGAAFDAALDRALGAESSGSGKGMLLVAASRVFGEDIDWEL